MSSCRRLQELIEHLRRFFGETVTIFTTSGGESGRGFTGVLISVNCDFVRLLTDIGPAPACALGSCCDRKHFDDEDFEDDEDDERGNRSRSRSRSRSRRNRIDCRSRSTGAIVDIPTRSIAAFVHNSL
jgi:hypothetical protein